MLVEVQARRVCSVHHNVYFCSVHPNGYLGLLCVHYAAAVLSYGHGCAVFVFEKDNPCKATARARDYFFTDMKQYYVMLCWCVHLVIWDICSLNWWMKKRRGFWRVPPRVGYMEARQGTEDSRQREDGRYIQSWLSIEQQGSWRNPATSLRPWKGTKKFPCPPAAIHPPSCYPTNTNPEIGWYGSWGWAYAVRTSPWNISISRFQHVWNIRQFQFLFNK